MNKLDIMKKLLALFLSVLCVSSAYSQTGSSFIPKLNLPSSPEAALLGRFGDIPISYYTGTANISVPLYSVKEGGMEIPITLEYHGRGIKVADEATWVGLGWNLTPGGTIIQEVRGNRDQLDGPSSSFYSSSGFAAFKDRLNTKPMGTYKKLLQQGLHYWIACSGGGYLQNGAGDDPSIIYNLLEGNGQPDIYHFNFAGYSGSFYINPETDEMVILEKGEHVFFERIGTGFKATTLDGNQFFFQIVEVAYGLATGTDEHTGYTYKLSSIKFPTGRTIYFNYLNSKANGVLMSQSAVMNYVCTPMIPPTANVDIQDTFFDMQTLTSIVTPEVTINFNLADREDINSYTTAKVKRLTSIDILSTVTQKKIKSFQFGQTYFLSSPTANYSGKRLKLDSVKEIGYTNGISQDTSMPPYLFEYDTSVQLPVKTSFATDFWGYFNGETLNTNLLPDLTYFNYTNAFEYQDFYPFNDDRNPFQYTYIGANRFTDNTKAGAYLLKKIVYPTRGSTEFSYEPNSFTNEFIPDQSQIKNFDGATNTVFKSNHLVDQNQTLADINPQTVYPFSVNFKLSKSTVLHFANSIFDGTGGPGGVAGVYTRAQMDGCYIKLKKIKGGVTTLIKEWNTINVLNVEYNLNHGKSWNEDVSIAYDPDPTVMYNVSVFFPGNSQTKPGDTYKIAHAKSWFTYYDDTGVERTSRQCGFRIARIRNLTEMGIVASDKIIKYVNEDGTPSGKLLNRFNPIWTLDSFCNKCGDAVDGVLLSSSTPFQQKLIRADDFGTEGGTIIGYSRVEEIEKASNSPGIGKRVYHYYNSHNSTNRNKPYLPDPINGKLIKEYVLAASGDTLVSKIYYNSSTCPLESYDALTIVNHSFGDADFGTGNSDTEEAYKFSFQTYPLISYCYRLSSITTKEKFGSSEIVTKEDYTYNGFGKIKEHVTTYADNSTSKKKYYYPGELTSTSAIETDMQNNKMYGIPIVTETYIGAELISSLNTEFIKDATTNDRILPKYIYSEKGNVSGMLPEKRVTYDRYDDKGNLLQYTLENGTPVSFIWGYNKTLPVAKIENLAYSSIPTGILTSIVSSSLATDDTQLSFDLAALRTHSALTSSITTTYVYNPLVGVKKIIDARGYSTNFFYDPFGRLILVKDDSGNILTNYKYHHILQN